MSKQEKSGKDVKGNISVEAWKKLKILAIQKDLSLPEMVTFAIEGFLSRKKIEGTEEVN